MKKILPLLVLFMLAMVLWNVFTPNDISVAFDGDEIDGPLGVVLGGLFAGGGLLIAVVVMAVVGIILAVVFAGLGLMMVAGLCLGAVLLALAVSPLMLPLLLPLGLIWFFTRRSRKASKTVPA